MPSATTTREDPYAYSYIDRRFFMPRHYEIDSAWRASIKREPNGRQTVTTEAFVSQLALINFHWSCRQANQWIETYVTVFKDISTQEGENRTFMLFNPNGGR
ncbi:phage tail fiber assembly protein (plasmid) [Enterobacter hormaechei]|jgi:hypothetical protein|uniref:DNA polymerase V n=48 Tax=cellular organisms TaxID=131567 RepID=K4IWF5_ECOLX|nr:hypothetical protein [Escherichia coli]AUF80917.1 hypothetical protein [Klebsiella pneumoniae]AXE42814.1 hypothetical protein [Enterobacter cloacae]MDC7837050.1 phage tail fiber assembly protein [Enterobacter hormaechei]QBQ69709.1 hypothetical protein [Klebsiella aerogenes]QJS00099.1 hypothetical protein [Escherichia coli O89:H9]